ncbi:MAG: PBP1A family penicillin-binding protein [Myxococcota bacterium]
MPSNRKPPSRSRRSRPRPPKVSQRPPRPPKARHTVHSQRLARPSNGPSAGAIVLELFVWGGGILAGLSLTAFLLWSQAQRDVAAYLASPPSEVPSTVWSAPITIEPDMPVDPEALSRDLLAAGYERVDNVLDKPGDGDGTGMFSLSGGRFDIWTFSGQSIGQGPPITEGRSRLEVRDRRVISVSRGGGIVLPPTRLARIGNPDQQRTPVKLDQMAEWIEPALLSMEDQRFREHSGIDLAGIVRALWSNLTRSKTQGGSTLTQQLAKNLFLSHDRTLRRKVREVFFAAALEQQLSKDEILELYLSEVYLGQMGGLPLYGVEQAAKAWFGTSAGKLTLAQSATIVGVIPSPNSYSPLRHAEVAKERRDLVLTQMVSVGKLESSAAERAKGEDVVIDGLAPSQVRSAPYAVDAAIERVEEELGQGVFSRGLDVYTTIHPLYQRAAEEAVALSMEALEKAYDKARGAQVGLASVRIDTGQVVALVGGRDYAESAFNRAVDGYRQIGSTVKPLTVAKAYTDHVANPATRLPDEPITVDLGGESWTPRNYDGKYEGEVTVRRAIEASRNIPSVHLAERVGLGKLKRFLLSTGLTKAHGLPSAALGAFEASPLEVAGAYTLFHSGVAHRPEIVTAVRTADGEWALEVRSNERMVVDPRAAAQAMHLLQSVVSNGTGRAASNFGVGHPAGGKTGTTDEYRDAWFVGLSPELSTAVWVGKDKGENLGLSGGRAALPTWARYMAATGTIKGVFPRPEGLREVELCIESSQRSRARCSETTTELFYAGDQPDQKCEVHGGAGAQIGKFFRNLFGKGDGDDTEEEGSSDDDKKSRKRRRRKDR